MHLLQQGASDVLGLCLTAKHLAAFQIYYEELVAWNQRFNLTTITEYQDVQIKHFLDSLTCLLALPAAPEDAQPSPIPDKVPISTTWKPLLCLDVGTGAGFPGVPLKIIRPELHLTLLEATAKKTIFLRHLVERLNLTKVEIIAGRAEEVGHDSHHRERYDVVLARAVAPLPVLAEYCLPFCRVGGRFVAPKGADTIAAECEKAERAVHILGGQVREIKEIEIPGLAQRRCLVIIDKVHPTPVSYPRRPGIPSKRPLK